MRPLIIRITRDDGPDYVTALNPTHIIRIAGSGNGWTVQTVDGAQHSQRGDGLLTVDELVGEWRACFQSE